MRYCFDLHTGEDIVDEEGVEYSPTMRPCVKLGQVEKPTSLTDPSENGSTNTFAPKSLCTAAMIFAMQANL